METGVVVRRKLGLGIGDKEDKGEGGVWGQRRKLTTNH
jgi:hypothetical protein